MSQQQLIDALAGGPAGYAQLASAIYGVDVETISARLRECMRARIVKMVSRARIQLARKNMTIFMCKKTQTYRLAGYDGF